MAMDKAKLEKLLDDLTVGLKADPEVRLDVKSELRSHLEEKIEEGLRSGLSGEESEKQALKAFGDIILVSDGLADANRRKMSFKARLKVFAAILLIPAVIICALICFEHSMLGVILTTNNLKGPAAYLDALDRNKNKDFWSFRKYTPEEELVLYGDKSRSTRAEQQEAIRERFPGDKVYQANYILILLADKKDDPDWRKKMFAALKTAKQIDADNALYDYIKAALLFEEACKISSEPKHRLIKNVRLDLSADNRKYHIEIKDRKLMEQAIAEYLKGTRKKYLKSYITDMLHRRLDIIGGPENIFENLHQIALAAATLLPHVNYLRDIAQSSLLYAEVLQKEGRQKEALKIVKPWKTYLKQITEDSDYLIGILITMAIAEFGEERVPAVYRKAGRIKTAEINRRELSRIAAVKKQWKDELADYPSNSQLEKTGVLAEMLLPALGKMYFKEEDFMISNRIEYTALEKAGVILLNLFFLLIMIGGGLSALYWRIRTGEKAILLAPSPQLIGKVFLLGIILPLTAYVLISISGMVGGHEYNIISNAVNLGAQFSILLIMIPLISFVLIKKHIRRRCLEIGISCPEIKKSRTRKIIFGIVFSILVLLALLPIHGGLPLNDFPRSLSYTYVPPFLIVLTVIPMCFLIAHIIIAIAEYFSAIFKGKKYALYYGALAKTMIPVFALAVIFMTLVVMPCLDWREADLISRDKVMYGRPETFTHAEYQVTQRLKTNMLKAME
jgi:hypothetical protein